MKKQSSIGPLLLQSTTGLEEDQFYDLLERVETILDGDSMEYRGRKRALTLETELVVTLMLLRHNMTEELVGSLFGVTQSAVSKIKDRMEPLIMQATASSELTLDVACQGRQVLVDGTYVPTGNRKQARRQNYSGKRHCQCVNIQVVCDRDDTLLAVSKPVPGARHDMKALEINGWDVTLSTKDWIADLGYIGTNALTPIKRSPGQELGSDQKEFNRVISGIRSAVERCIAHLKNWKILKTGYRRQLKRLATIIQLVTRLEMFRLGW